MHKKHIALMLSALILASSALSCASETPEDYVLSVIDTLQDKVGTSKDCASLTKEINDYCIDVSKSLNAAVKEIKYDRCLNMYSPAIIKIKESRKELNNLAKKTCNNKDDKLEDALKRCDDIIDFDI